MTDGVTAYSISTWRLEPHTTGPGAHSHPEDDVFLVTEGTMSFLVDGERRDAPTGTFVLVPGGATHDFENCSDAAATVFNVSVPGEFEPAMAGIVDWFRAPSAVANLLVDAPARNHREENQDFLRFGVTDGGGGLCYDVFFLAEHAARRGGTPSRGRHRAPGGAAPAPGGQTVRPPPAKEPFVSAATTTFSPSSTCSACTSTSASRRSSRTARRARS